MLVMETMRCLQSSVFGVTLKLNIESTLTALPQSVEGGGVCPLEDHAVPAEPLEPRRHQPGVRLCHE